MMVWETTRLPMADVEKNARYLTVAGALVLLHPDQVAAFSAFRALLVGGGRAKQWGTTLPAVPPTQEGVEWLVSTVQAYERMAGRGHFQSLMDARIAQLPEVVAGMVAVSRAPQAYLDECAKEWFDHPTIVFSSTTRKKITPKLRGLLGDLPATERKKAHRRVG